MAPNWVAFTKEAEGCGWEGSDGKAPKKNAVDTLQATAAGSIQQAPGYCCEFVSMSPGSVAIVEVSTQPP